MLLLSILAYAGLAAMVLGAIGLLRPVPRLGLGTRARALRLTIAGILCCGVSVFCPHRPCACRARPPLSTT